MKRSFLAIALLACASIASACYDAVASACLAVKGFVLGAFSTMAAEPVEPRKPMVQRVQAKAFMQRIEKRERPVVTSSW